VLLICARAIFMGDAPILLGCARLPLMQGILASVTPVLSGANQAVQLFQYKTRDDII
jgi:hypothetical protein